MNNIIVLTFDEVDVERLYAKVGREFNNINFWGNPKINYNTEWVWTVINGELSGCSGFKPLEHTIKRCPELTIVNITQFLNPTPCPPTK